MKIETMIAAAVAGAAPAAEPAALRYIRQTLGLNRFRVAAADLGGDRRAELIVLARDRGSCGSGGCTLYVLARRGRGYRIVSRVSVSRAPIRVLASRTRGWRDLGVSVAGGGIVRGYEARLRFDGRGYPRNPTLAPTSPRGASGTIVLP